MRELVTHIIDEIERVQELKSHFDFTSRHYVTATKAELALIEAMDTIHDTYQYGIRSVEKEVELLKRIKSAFKKSEE